VLVRESAPLSALREEGIHAAQLLDPRTAADVKLLDEAHMARWNSLDLKTKLEMYRAKLDLELDAHRRLLTGLLEQIDEMPPGVARDALVDQAEARRTAQPRRTKDRFGAVRTSTVSTPDSGSTLRAPRTAALPVQQDACSPSRVEVRRRPFTWTRRGGRWVVAPQIRAEARAARRWVVASETANLENLRGQLRSVRRSAA
jgi:hypothetical protein